ncbi:MAG: ABC transporter ATP-binding protein [Owenweeksia sp.]
MKDIAIHIENLSKEYSIKVSGHTESFKALDFVNLEIERGKIMGIIGSNGAGKSTLLKILSRITYPTSGKVTVNGRLASLLEVGTGFHSELSGRENIYLNGSILGMSRQEIRSKFDDIVEFSGIEKFIDTPVKHYSSGMYVRLAFSVAANLTPEILIIDEVLAVGDAQFQARCLQKMDEAKSAEGRTILFVSHNMTAINHLCDEVAWLQDGKIKQLGKAEEITQNYLQDLRQRSQEIALRDRTDRGGTGEAVFTRLEWLSPQNGALISGEPATLKVSYASEKLETIGNLRCVFNIYKSNQEFLVTLNNEMSGYGINQVPGSGSLYCHFDHLPFMHGEYSITCNLFVNGLRSDKVEQAFRFKVSEGDYYNSGHKTAEKRPGVYVAQQWDTSPPEY